MAKKSARILVRMVAEDGSGHFYTTEVNPNNIEGKLNLRKYNPVARKYMKYVQSKIK